MSEENMEIVRRIYEAVGRGDTKAVLALYDPDVEWDFSRSPFRVVITHDSYRGRDGLQAFIRDRHEDGWETAQDELLELIDAGEHVVSIVKSRGRGRVSGAQVEKTHAGVWTFRRGRVIRVAWMNRGEALKAAGLSE